MKTRAVKVADNHFAQIPSAPEARNPSKSGFVRERLDHDKAAAKHAKSSLWSRMEDLVIRSDSLPPDLSAKKAHQKKYGQRRVALLINASVPQAA